MNAGDVLRRLNDLEVELTPRPNGNLYLAPASLIPTDLLEQVRRYNAELLVCVAPLYRLAYPGEGPGNGEMAELERRVREDGYVLCWAEVLKDYIAFHRDDVDPATMPAGCMPYSDTELRHLYGEDKPDRSPWALRTIHAAKKVGARITDNIPDSPVERERP